MNTFITFALFALCATVAQGQLISGLPYGLYSDIVSQNSGSSGSASSAAAASSSSSAANNGVVQSSRLISPLAGYPAVGAPYYAQGYPAPLGYPYGAYPAPLGAYPPFNAYGAGVLPLY